MKGEIKNAQITDVTLSMENHGCLTYGLWLKFSGCACMFGGYCIGHGYLGADHFDGSSKGLEAMMRIMDVVGVEKWENLKNKYVRIIDNGLGNPIDDIGNIIEDKWFNQREFFSM